MNHSTYVHDNNYFTDAYAKNTENLNVPYNEQMEIIKNQEQAKIGKIKDGIKRFSHADQIQGSRYGFNTNKIDIAENSSNKYDPYFDYLNKNGLLNENIKYRLRTSTLNIDSSRRDRDPIVAYGSEYKLSKNPLSYELLTKEIGINSSVINLLKIYCPNHKLVVGDRFILGGIYNPTTSINTTYTDINDNIQYSVIFTHGSTSVAFICNYNIQTNDNLNNISFNPNFKVGTGIEYSTLKSYDTSNLKVNINGFTVSSSGLPYVGNIPINYLNSNHQIYFTNPDPTGTNDIINVPFTSYNGTELVKITGFYISLNTAYDGSALINNMKIDLTFNHFGGIPLNQLNAEFPVDNNHSIGYHEVFSIEKDQIITIINNTAYYYEINAGNMNVQDSFGGKNVYISKITDLTYGYNNPNSYVFNLPKALHNAISVKLTSTTFPNTSKIIRNTPNNNNNMLYWQNQDDGNYTYSISLNAGNYTPTSLKSEIEKKVYNVKRKFATIFNTNSNYTNNNYMSVFIQTDTNIVTFESYKEAQLITPIQSISPTIPDKGGSPPYTLTIKQNAHGLKVGDEILFSDFITTMGISDAVLNKTQIVTEISTPDTYKIVLNNFNLFTGSRIDTQGGYAAKVFVPNNFRLLFNSDDTFGSLLGFRNVGEETSITKFSTKISNADSYENEIITTDSAGNKYVYDKSGNTQFLASDNIKLSGYDYILMSIKELDTTLNLSTSKILKCFAKINLTGLPGKILYDTFVQTTTLSYDPINLTKLTVNLYAPDGTYFDFNGMDHSFVLEITTMNHTIIDEGIVSNTSIF